MKGTTTINGFTVTDNVAEVLGHWSESDAPERYASYLSEVQDVLCRVMCMSDDFDSSIKECLINLICIKDDFKKINEKGTENE